MKIGVFIPICDSKIYSLDKILKAITNQTKKVDKIIIVADTKSPDLYKSFEDEYHLYTIYWHSNWVEGKMNSIAFNRELIFMLAKIFMLDYFWMIDSDIEPPPDALERMLSLNENAVSAICWAPGKAGDMPYVFYWDPPEELKKLGNPPHFVRNLPESGILKDHNYFVGFGCVLLKNLPIFHNVNIWKREYDSGEDINFWWTLKKEYGIKPVIICDLHCKHHAKDGSISPSFLKKVSWY